MHARGNISLDEKDRLIAEVEKRVLAFAEPRRRSTPASASSRAAWARSPRIRSASSSSSSSTGASGRSAHDIMDAIREKTADIPGILVEVTAPRAGPPTGKPIQVQLSALDPIVLPGGGEEGRRHPVAQRADIRDLDDGQPLPGIDWKIEVDKAEAAKYGAGVGHGRQRRAARHQRPKGDRIPARRQRQGGRHPGALPARSAQPRPDRRSAHPDSGRACPDRQFRAACAGAARRLHQSRQRQSRDDGIGQHRRRRADRQRTAGDCAGIVQDRSRTRRQLQAEGRGRGARKGSAPS